MYFFFDSSAKVAKITGHSTLKITDAAAYPGTTCYIAFDDFSVPGWAPIR